VRLLVVRHYKTQINAKRHIMGWGDSPPINGWERDMLAVLDRLQAMDLRIDAIYTSGLKRARATGEFYANQLAVEGLFSDDALNEVNYGSLFDKSKKWVAQHVPEYKTDPDFVFPEGESFTQMQQRSIAFVESLTGRDEEQTLLLVVHAGVVRGMICHYLGLDYGQNLKRRVSHRYIGDFQFGRSRLQGYDELGSHSDFVSDGILSLPVHTCPEVRVAS
jgi:alpha-ribazole phosphatase